MMNPKIIIVVKGGAVIATHSTHEIDVLVIDYDNNHNGYSPLNGVYAQDSIFESGNAVSLFSGDSKDDQLIKEHLSSIKF